MLDILYVIHVYVYVYTIYLEQILRRKLCLRYRWPAHCVRCVVCTQIRITTSQTEC